MPSLICLAMLLAVAAHAADSAASAWEADPPDSILLLPGTPAIVPAGSAVLLPQAKGKPEQLEAAAARGRPLIEFGRFGKPTAGPCSAEVIARIPADGHYEVWLRWYTPEMAHGHCQALPVTISCAGAAYGITVNQQLGNAWTLLGAFPFRAGGATVLRLDAAGTVGTANLLAARLVPVPAPPARTPAKSPPARLTGDQDFDRLRAVAFDRLTMPVAAESGDRVVCEKVLQEQSAAYLAWRTLRLDPAVDPWTDIDLPKENRGNFEVHQAMQRLAEMASANACSSSRFGFARAMQGDERMRRDILAGMARVMASNYNRKSENRAGADWFGCEIGIPRSLVQIMILLHDHIPAAQRDEALAAIENMTSDPRRMYLKNGFSTGFNRLSLVRVHLLRGLIEQDRKRMQSARDALWDTLRVRRRTDDPPPFENDPKAKPNSDGFYADGTFIQHGDLPYMAIYGMGLLREMADVRALLNGSPWSLEGDPRIAGLRDWVFQGIEPLMYRGDTFYRSIGRSVGQKWAQNGVVAFDIAAVVARMIDTATPEDRTAYQGMIRTWLDEDGFDGSTVYPRQRRNLTLDALATLRAIKADPAIAPRPRPLGPHLFHNSDMLVHHRPGFAASLAMSSTRIATHEMMQGVNNRGWYQGDGALFISLPDHLRFNDGFWPTVDPYRLPGITVDTRPRKDGDTGPANQGHVQLNPWAGGAVLDRNAVAGMELAPPDITLRARKSWFFIGDRIVCLGAGIGSGDGRVIETVVENAKLAADGGNVLSIDGKAAPAELGWSGQADAASWVHLAGATPASDCGWVFAAGAKTLRLKREARTGSWVKLFTKDDVTPLTRNYLTMWLDHGSSPRDAGYAYTILPGAGAAQVAAYAAKPEIAIAANTPAIQAVTAPGLRAASFWDAAGGAVAGIAVTGQAAVVVEEGPAGLAVAIADPTQLGTGLELRLDAQVGPPTACDPAITVASRSPLRLTVDLAGSDGRSLVVRFAR